MDNGRFMDPIRLATHLFDTMSNLSANVVYFSIIGILLVCGLGIPIPEDITLLAAGLLASTGHITLPGALIAGFAGVMIGDSFLFFMGRKFGAKIFGLPVLRSILTPARIKAAENRVRRNGHFICFIARFLPGLRSPIFALSGAMGVRPAVFIIQDGFAALISVPLWVYLGYWFGNNWDEAFRQAEKIQVFVLSGVVLLVAGYLIYRFFKRRKDRQHVKTAI